MPSEQFASGAKVVFDVINYYLYGRESSTRDVKSLPSSKGPKHRDFMGSQRIRTTVIWFICNVIRRGQGWHR